MEHYLAPVRGSLRDAGFRRLSHGLFLPISQRFDEREERRRDLEAWLHVLPPDAVFTHITAAELLGWWLPILPPFVPVYAATAHPTSRPRRQGLVCSRLPRQPGVGQVDGLPIDTVEEIILRLARELSELDLVVLIESAIRCGHVDQARLRLLCQTRGRPGVVRLRQVMPFVDGRAESAIEVLLRVFHELIGVPVEPQVDLFTLTGAHVGRVDLLITGTRFAQELDGQVHLLTRQQAVDRRRERAISGTDYVRRGYTTDDIVNHPLVVLAEIDRFLERRHRTQRADRWRAWVARSSYTEAGRARLHNRWLGFADVSDRWRPIR